MAERPITRDPAKIVKVLDETCSELLKLGAEYRALSVMLSIHGGADEDLADAVLEGSETAIKILEYNIRSLKRGKADAMNAPARGGTH